MPLDTVSLFPQALNVPDDNNRSARGGYLDVRPEAEKRYNKRLSADLERTIWTRCDSYFRSPTGRIVTQWPYTELEYARRTWRLRTRDWVHRTGVEAFSG